jgi:hypothetical protein
MANYSLVINSRFRPFSYQEMLAPTLQSTQAHQALEDAYSTLGLQAGTVESMLNKELDSDAYNQYQGFMQGLKESADILATQGLNPSLRGSLNNLSTRYSREIIPIQKAAERREKLAEEQRNLGPNYEFEYDVSMTGLDKFMNNPTFTPKKINLAEIRQRSATEFGQLAQQLGSFAEDENMYHKGFDSTVLAKYGYSEKDALRVMESIRRGQVSPEDAAASAIYNSIYGSTGVDSWSNNLSEGQQAVRNAIAEGVVGAIGKNIPQIVTDKMAEEDYHYRKELQSYKEKARIDAEKAAKDALANANGAGVIVPLRSKRELSKNAKIIEKYRKYFTFDSEGNAVLNAEGIKHLFINEASGITGDDVFNYTIKPTSGVDRRPIKHAIRPTQFGKFVLDAMGETNPEALLNKGLFTSSDGVNYLTNENALNNLSVPSIFLNASTENGKLVDRIGAAYNTLAANNNEQSYDTYRTTEIDIPLDNTQGEAVTESIMRNTPNNVKIKEVDFNGNTRNFEGTGNEYSKSELEGYRVTAIRPSKHGTTAFIHKDGMDDIRIMIPKGVNIGNLDALQQGTTELNAWVQAANSEYKPMLEKGKDGNGYIMLDENGDVVFTNQKSSKADRQSYLEQAELVKANTIHNGATIVRQTTATKEEH